MTSTPLIDALTAYTKATSDPWDPGHQQRKADATLELRAAVQALTRRGVQSIDADRVWAALEAERAYAEANAAAGDKMHRTTPEYGHVVSLELARATADRDGIPAGAERAFCRTCRTWRAVEDTDNHASYYRGDRELEVTATHLACGHTMTGPERVVGASPGGEAAAEALAGAATQARLARAARAQDEL